MLKLKRIGQLKSYIIRVTFDYPVVSASKEDALDHVRESIESAFPGGLIIRSNFIGEVGFPDEEEKSFNPSKKDNRNKTKLRKR